MHDQLHLCYTVCRRLTSFTGTYGGHACQQGIQLTAGLCTLLKLP